MQLRFYNTLSRSKNAFLPIDDRMVRLYVCGPTVYDQAHIGNARPVIVFDVLYRLLRHVYGTRHVRYVRNITDVDDKINARARERGISIRELTEATAAQFHKDVAALGCLPPDVEPRATEHIGAMVALIERLVARGHAYAAAGHVLFSVPSMPDYGALSRRPLDEMIAGARVEVAPYKKNDMDFVLWKPAADDEPGWESPWGRGRPGWHIECSAMSAVHLGETFDIHGGGIDLMFPHHENEIAQSRCGFGHDVMANVFMHNGFLQVEGRKMSKSEGNFITIAELLETKSFGGRRWSGEVVRLAMLRTHYRQPIDWTVAALEEAEKTLDRWYDVIGDSSWDDDGIDETFLEKLADDLNTSAALADLHAMASSEASAERPRPGARPLKQLKNCANLLGLLHLTQTQWRALREPVANQDAAKVESLIGARLAARASKDWAESDRIRDELAAMGVALKDNKDGTTSWEFKR